VRTRVALGFVAVLTIGAAACGDDDGSSADSSEGQGGGSDASVDWLFVQNASTGSLEATGSGTYRLLMQDVDASTVAFSDTPYREVRSLPTPDVVDSIAAAAQKPNAALQIRTEPLTTVVLTLTSATYDAASETATYEGELVEDGALADMESEGDVPDGSLTQPTLFVDGEPVAPPSDDPASDFSVGATCETTGHNEEYCWLAEPGGENWPPMDDSITVTFKNIGSDTSWFFTGYVPILGGCEQGTNPIDPGHTVTLTFHHKNEICIVASDNIPNPTPTAYEITEIDN